MDRENSIHKVTDSRESVSLAFRGLIQSFNRAMMGEADPEKARAMVARVVGGLGTDGRKVLLEALMEHIPKGTPLPLMKMALRDGPYPEVLDPEGTIAKAQARVRESANNHAANIQAQLTDLAAELLTDFGEDDFVDDAPKKPGTHKQEFLSHVMRFQALVDEYERSNGQLGTKPRRTSRSSRSQSVTGFLNWQSTSPVRQARWKVSRPSKFPSWKRPWKNSRSPL